ncbi:hypothetical protein [Pontibacter russatus]|uniref:hypothetical protein n=1 Tax=Pontibacter russatus TaxID=2694929 RepID=UPI00137972E5|nr:hypothetical protein [Pontibacter russatus]
MKKTGMTAFMAFALATLAACGDGGANTAAEEMETIDTEETPTDVQLDIEDDSAETLDPDTAVYHDMTL